jgi:hypothetical protein
VGENETKVLFGRRGRRWEDDIEMHHAVIG